MIKTKISLIVFTILLVILFPFSILFWKSDYATSVIPGWHTTIISPYLTATLFKSVLLLIVVVLYWKLNKVVKEIDLKIFILHLTLTIPSILNSKLPLHSFIEFDRNDMTKTANEIEIVNSIVIVLNVLFVIGQVIFGIYYVKKRNIGKVSK
ncbi:hypothetical protein IVB69_01905 [Flavobacterium sp. J49]|uniref:hypothetical protein n=1 Tax=Flavobacterium sp. J49 TaxID=2718534 RepID=UPI001594D35B|nr:hypothetical protein [Flavobacterium sp. J49]MBF6640225.1 hypothetical protein [Flavobacterium sp. J49]NIC01470.1 hypothetical protein [Flavobacterium sp. J49]